MVGFVGSNPAALKAFGTKMEVTANNVANVNSDEFKKSRATLKEGENGALRLMLNVSTHPVLPLMS